jgi:hypothetical protein
MADSTGGKKTRSCSNKCRDREGKDKGGRRTVGVKRARVRERKKDRERDRFGEN